MSKPLDPAKTHQAPPPAEVLDSVNELIEENLRGREARVLQKDLEARMVSKGLAVEEIYDKKWMDVEDIYRRAGWTVEYDRPIYYGGEDFDAYFVFTKPKDL